MNRNDNHKETARMYTLLFVVGFLAKGTLGKCVFLFSWYFYIFLFVFSDMIYAQLFDLAVKDTPFYFYMLCGAVLKTFSKCYFYFYFIYIKVTLINRNIYIIFFLNFRLTSREMFFV